MFDEGDLVRDVDVDPAYSPIYRVDTCSDDRVIIYNVITGSGCVKLADNLEYISSGDPAFNNIEAMKHLNSMILAANKLMQHLKTQDVSEPVVQDAIDVINYRLNAMQESFIDE